MRRVLPFFFLSIISVVVYAYNLDGNRWADAKAEFTINIPGLAPSGISWSQGFKEAAKEWTENTSFSFSVSQGDLTPCDGFSGNGSSDDFPEGDGDKHNSAGFADTVCGNEFGENVLAITLTLARGGNLGFAYIDQSDIIFNSTFEWDIYTGPKRPEIDFRRVALHELGHTIGLDHETDKLAIMAPAIGNIDTLQADDIAGANALYNGPGDCQITTIHINIVINDALRDGDCSVLELYGGGVDTSFVDTYQLLLTQDTTVNIQMESATLDSVLLITDSKLSGIDFDDDSAGSCNARIRSTLPAGEYLILANTYVEPLKCLGNVGSYKISITDNQLPILNNARTLSGDSTNSMFHGGATADKGETYKKEFSQSETVDVTASIQPDPDHIGKQATFYIVAVLSNGNQFARLETGKYKQITNLKNIPAYAHTNTLAIKENIPLLKNLKGSALGISNLGASFFVGYSLDEAPSEIYFNGSPISLLIQ